MLRQPNIPYKLPVLFDEWKSLFPVNFYFEGRVAVKRMVNDGNYLGKNCPHC